LIDELSPALRESAGTFILILKEGNELGVMQLLNEKLETGRFG